MDPFSHELLIEVQERDPVGQHAGEGSSLPCLRSRRMPVEMRSHDRSRATTVGCARGAKMAMNRAAAGSRQRTGAWRRWVAPAHPSARCPSQQCRFPGERRGPRPDVRYGGAPQRHPDPFGRSAHPLTRPHRGSASRSARGWFRRRGRGSGCPVPHSARGCVAWRRVTRHLGDDPRAFDKSGGAPSPGPERKAQGIEARDYAPRRVGGLSRPHLPDEGGRARS